MCLFAGFSESLNEQKLTCHLIPYTVSSADGADEPDGVVFREEIKPSIQKWKVFFKFTFQEFLSAPLANINQQKTKTCRVALVLLNVNISQIDTKTKRRGVKGPIILHPNVVFYVVI